jgi:hypothetical protein
MSKFIACLDRWRQLYNRVRDGESVWLFAPRHYGEQAVLTCLAQALQAQRKAVCVSLSSLGQRGTGRLDYGKVWESTRSQLGSTANPPVAEREDYLKALRDALARRKGLRCVFLLQGARRGNEENHWDIVALFNSLLLEYQGRSPNLKPSVVAADDYSLYYYDRAKMAERTWSDLAAYGSFHFGPLSADEIAAGMTGLARARGPALADGRAAELAAVIHRLTGGHVGLVQEMMAELEQGGWQLPDHDREEDALALLRSSPTLESITRVLEEDAEAYCRTAMQYVKPDIPERNSPRIHVLHQVGVLIKVRSSMFQLCPGAIARLVEDTWDRLPDAPANIGLLANPEGPCPFAIGRTMELSDDDFVILHLSDLHVSADYYRFRLALPDGRTKNAGELAATDLLYHDLREMGLEKRVDALVLTGDFTWFAKLDEFSRAREVIREIMERLCLTADRVLLIPGNHDMEWNPPELAPTHYHKRVSREAYNIFVELLLGAKPNGESELLPVVSRSGRRKLRLLGLDSNRVEGEKAQGLGYVSREALEQAAKQLEADLTDGFDHVCTWMAVHHHVFPATSVQLDDALEKRVSLMGNTLELQQYAAQWGVEAILHGHEHQPSVTVASRWPVADRLDFCPLAVIGAGSFSVGREKLGPFSHNHYYVLCRRAQDIIVRSRRTGDARVNFTLHHDLILPLRARGQELPAGGNGREHEDTRHNRPVPPPADGRRKPSSARAARGRRK